MSSISLLVGILLLNLKDVPKKYNYTIFTIKNTIILNLKPPLKVKNFFRYKVSLYLFFGDSITP